MYNWIAVIATAAAALTSLSALIELRILIRPQLDSNNNNNNTINVLLYYNGEAYIEMEEGSHFTIECLSNETIEFIFPNNAFNTGYDSHREMIHNRTTFLHNERGVVIRIDDLHKYDSGNYSCRSISSNVAIYIFVASRNKSSSIFLNEHPIFMSTDLRKPFIEIPCRTDRLIRDVQRVRLLINGRKSAVKRIYDPRKGFIVESSSLRWLLANGLLQFTCEYNSSKSVVIAIVDRSNHTRFVIDADQWPYMGNAFKLSCSLIPADHNYDIYWKCPRCAHIPSVISERFERDNEGMKDVLTVSSPSQQDNGLYECVRVRRSDRKMIESRFHTINVSKSRGQMKLLNMSKSSIEIKEGESIVIFMDAAIYPPFEYNHHWSKTYYGELSNVTRSVIGNITSTFRNKSNQNWIRERLFITNATHEDAGIYQLNVNIGNDFKVSLNWTVIVHPLERQVDISFMSYGTVGEDVILIGKSAIIKCKINDDNISGVLVEWHNVSGGNCITADSNELTINKYTYGSVLRWNVTLFDDSLFRCRDKQSGEVKELYLRVSALTSMRIIRDDRNGHFILVCQLPIGREGDVYWFKDDEAFGPMNGTKENFMQVYPIDTMLFTSMYGKFECVLDMQGDEESASYEISNVVVHRLPQNVTWILAIFVGFVVVIFAICVVLIVRQRQRNLEQAKRLKALFAQLMRTDTESTVITTTTTTDSSSECIDFHQQQQDQRPLHERIDQLPYQQKYEIARERITFEKFLGNGEYGSVYLCHVMKDTPHGDNNDVQFIRAAAKRPRNRYNAEHYEALAAELRIMIAVASHPNILCLVGAVVKHLKSNYLYVITEFCELGDLRSVVFKMRDNYVDEVIDMRKQITENGYLLSNTDRRYSGQCYRAQVSPEWDILIDSERANGRVFSTCDLISFGFQTANGMTYLASKLCIHRDLAARNIFVTKDRIVRIADFGLARKDERIYQMKSDCPMPIRWMSPEALTCKEFSEKSDVWSFGVLLWELFTFGEYPYASVHDNDELYDRLCKGYQLEMPSHAPKAVYSIMKSCWHFNAKDRPTFIECRSQLEMQLELVSSLAKKRLMKTLEEEVLVMQQYAEYRDDASLASAAVAAAATTLSTKGTGVV